MLFLHYIYLILLDIYVWVSECLRDAYCVYLSLTCFWQLGDVLGMATAQMNIGDLCKVLGLPMDTEPSPPAEPTPAPRTPFNALRVRRQSMEQLSLIQVSRCTSLLLETEFYKLRIVIL